MKNVFISKTDGKYRFTQGLTTLAEHYCFNPTVAPAYAPWVKGKIERPMDYIRERFWRGYRFTDIHNANKDLMSFLLEKSNRTHSTTKERISERFEREKEFYYKSNL